MRIELCRGDTDIKAGQRVAATVSGRSRNKRLGHDKGIWIAHQLGSLTAKKTAKAADKGG